MNKVLSLNEADEILLEKSLCKDLSEFVEAGWPTIDSEPFLPNWHIDAICEHLEAVAEGVLNRLLINVPPGTSKSTLNSVFFPAWVWGPLGKPHWKFIGASHEQGLASRDNRRTRLLVESEWYQKRWPIRLTTDQNEKTYFENEHFGFRQSTAVRSMTGRRSDVVIWDDPQNPEKAYSDVERATAIRVMQETLPNRMINPEKSAIIVIMQRLHQDDISGFILEKELGYEHLMLPMEFEPDRKCYTSIGFEDPREEEGELLHPARFPDSVIERDKKAMGAFAIAGQYQQRPVPRGGAVFLRGWFEFVSALPSDCKTVRGWDLAATADSKAPWTRGVKLSRSKSTKRFYASDCVGIQGNPGEVKRLVKSTAIGDGISVKGSLPQDPGQAGKAQALDFVSDLAGYSYTATPETGDKIVRATPVAAQAEAGNFCIVKTGDPARDAWIEPFIDELCSFPFGTFSDQVDALSRAFSHLIMEPDHNSGTVELRL